MKKMIVICLCSLMLALSGVSSASVGMGGKAKVQTFPDVPPESIYYDSVEACNAAGIMVGYENGNFGPNDPLTRAQAAVVIERAAFAQFSAPDLPKQLHFDDVTGSDWYQPWVEDFAERGITSGCAARAYCPELNTSRDHVAVFLLRSLGEFNPPTPATQRFLDVPPSHPQYNFIDRLAELGITLGCGGGNYCPTLAVTRGDMSLFIVRAFDLE